MSHDLRFQVITLPGPSWDDVVMRFKYIEELGFDLVTTADHFVDWTNPPAPWFEAWTLLAALARETSRIRIATYVTQFPLRNPAMLAREALTVDHISGGRLEVGLGTGLEIDPSYDAAGIPNCKAKERVARFREYVEIVDKLLSNEKTSFEGKYYQVKDAMMNPRPVQRPRPPIVIGALGPVMLKITAEFADNWNSLSFLEDFDSQIEETRTRIDRIDAACDVLGRDPASLRRSFLMFDPGSRASGGAIAYYDSADSFAERAERLIELGITEIGLYFPTVDAQRPVFEKIASDVIPRLKDA